MTKKRRKPSWLKLVVDGKVLVVYPYSKELALYRKLATLKGIRITKAERKEYKEFLLRASNGKI